MAFSNTVTKTRMIAPGLALETGTWNAASVTTGTITAATTQTVNVGKIEAWGFASDGDNAVLPARDVADNTIKITCTSSDTGNYWILGPAC